MSPQPLRREATYADLVALPDNVVGEIIDGVLHLQARPAPPHAIAGSSMGADLNYLFGRKLDDPQGPGGWWILDEPELALGRQVLVPDVAGWLRERMPQRPSTAQFHLPPDWVCEVVSPGTARKDRMQKLPIYAEHGVRWAWLVDPLNQTLEAFELEGKRWFLLGSWVGDAPARVTPFAEVELAMARWWEDGTVVEPAADTQASVDP